MQYVTWVTHPGTSANPTRYVTEAVDSPAMDRKLALLRKAGVSLSVWYVETDDEPGEAEDEPGLHKRG